MSNSEQVQPGDPDCVCQGTGLTCRLVAGSPDPSSIEMCGCVLKRLALSNSEQVEAVDHRAGDQNPSHTKPCNEVRERLEEIADSLPRSGFNPDTPSADAQFLRDLSEQLGEDARNRTGFLPADLAALAKRWREEAASYRDASISATSVPAGASCIGKGEALDDAADELESLGTGGGGEDSLRVALDEALESDAVVELAAKAWAATLVRRGWERPVPPPELAAARNALQTIQPHLLAAVTQPNPPATPVRKDGKLLPQDRARMLRWYVDLLEGERVTLDSLDFPAFRHACEALGITPAASSEYEQQPESHQVEGPPRRERLRAAILSAADALEPAYRDGKDASREVVRTVWNDLHVALARDDELPDCQPPEGQGEALSDFLRKRATFTQGDLSPAEAHALYEQRQREIRSEGQGEKTGNRCDGCDREEHVGDEGWESRDGIDWCPGCFVPSEGQGEPESFEFPPAVDEALGALFGDIEHDINCGIPNPADPDQSRCCTCGVDERKQRLEDALTDALLIAKSSSEGQGEDGWQGVWLIRVRNVIEPKLLLCLHRVAAEGWEEVGAEVRRYHPAPDGEDR